MHKNLGTHQQGGVAILLGGELRQYAKEANQTLGALGGGVLGTSTANRVMLHI